MYDGIRPIRGPNTSSKRGNEMNTMAQTTKKQSVAGVIVGITALAVIVLIVVHALITSTPPDPNGFSKLSCGRLAVEKASAEVQVRRWAPGTEERSFYVQRLGNIVEWQKEKGC